MIQVANHRRVIWTHALRLLTCAALTVGALARGQAAAPSPAATVPAAPQPVTFPPALTVTKTAAAMTQQQSTALTQYVDSAINVIGMPTAADVVRRTRNELELAATPPTGQPFSPAYERAFFPALSNAVTKAMQSPDVRTRTDISVALYRIAKRSKNVAIAPAVSAMLRDKSEAVVDWGVKSARELYPTLLAADPKAADALGKLVIAAIRTYPRNERILEDAFEALNNDAVQQAAANARGAIDTMIALLQARAQTFENAVAAALPEDEGTNFPAVVVSASRTAKAAPGMEKAVVDFLVLKAWPGDMMSPQQKAAAGRAMFDLAAQIGRLAPLLPPTDPQNPLLVRRDDLVAIARSVIPAIGVAGAHGEVVAVKTAATSLGNLFPRTGALNPLAIGAALQDLQAAMTDGKMLADKSAAGGGGGSKTRSEAIEGKREE